MNKRKPSKDEFFLVMFWSIITLLLVVPVVVWANV